MGDIYMTKEMGRKLVILVIGVMLAFLVLIGIVFYYGHQARVNLAESEDKAKAALVKSQRAGCERAKADRKVNSQGWRTAQAARLRSLSADLDISYKSVQQLVAADPSPEDPGDLVAARKYDQIATELEARSNIDCAEVFPSIDV
jgi:hypothetical protein